MTVTVKVLIPAKTAGMDNPIAGSSKNITVNLLKIL